MGKVIFLLIAVFMCYKIWSAHGINKLYWYFAGILFFPQTVIILEKPFTPFPRIMVIALFATVLFQVKNWRRLYKSFPLRISMLIMFAALMLIGISDERVNAFLKIYRPLTYFLENFFILFLPYVYINSLDDSRKIYRFLIRCMLVFSVYGLINFITRQSFYTAWISDIYNTVDNGNIYTNDGAGRFRISSFAWHPIYYGLLLATVIMVAVHLLYTSPKYDQDTKITRLTLGLLIVNLLWTNSRTPLLSLLAGLGIFFVFGVSFQRKIKLLIIGLTATLTAMTIAPSAFGLVSESFNTFSSKGSNLKGSSVEMRQAQMAASLLLFYKSPVVGNGYNYITEDLGFAARKEDRKSDLDFAGFESYSYKLLIEQGTVGIVANIVFFISLLAYFISMVGKVDTRGRNLAVISIGMTVAFLAFILGTGDMGTATFFLSILSINVKLVQNSLKRNNALDESAPNISTNEALV